MSVHLCEAMKPSKERKAVAQKARTPVSSVTQSLGVMNVCRRITEPAALTCTFEMHKIHVPRMTESIHQS